MTPSLSSDSGSVPNHHQEESGSGMARAQRCLILALVLFDVLAVFPLTTNPTADIKILGYELCAFVAFVLWLFTPRLKTNELAKSSLLFPALLTYSILTLAAATVSVNPGYSLCREFIKWLALFVLFIAAADAFHTPRHVWALGGAICIAMSIASLYGLAQHKGLDPFPWHDTTGMLLKGPSTFGNPNFASHALAPALILACGLCFQRRGRWALLCIPIFLAHLALTRTRGSILGLAGASLLVLVAVVVARKVKSPRRAIALTLIVVLATGVFGVGAAVTVSKMKTGQPYPYDSGESIMLRYHSFYGACRMIQDRPWLGYGPGMYEVASPPYWTPLQKDRFSELRRADDHVHCEPLEIAVESGLPAAILYIGVFVLGIYYGLRLWFAPNGSGRRSLGLTSAAFFFAFFLDGLFGFNVHVPVSALLLFLIAGAMAGVWREGQTPSPRLALHLGVFPVLWRCGAFVCVALIPTLGIRDFSCEFQVKRGYGAISYNAQAAANACFQKAEALEPYSWIPPYYQGVLAMQKDALETVDRHFSRTLKLNPNYLVAQFSIAKAIFNMAQQAPGTIDMATLNRAVDYAQRAAKISPRFPEVQELLGRTAYLRAETQSAQGKADNSAADAWLEAEQYLLKAIEFGGNQKFRLYQLLAGAQLERGDGLGAQKALVYALEDNPGEMETWRIFFEMSRKTGQYHAILSSLDKRIETLTLKKTGPSDEQATLQLLQARVVYLGYGDVPAAEAAFQKLVEAYPARLDAWMEFSAFAKSVGREDVFSASLQRLVAARDKAGQGVPPIVHAVALGLSQSEEGMVAGVSALVDTVQRRPTANADGMNDALAWAAGILGRQAQQAPLAPKNAGDVFLKLALVYGACQDYQSAVQFLDRAEPNLLGQQLLLCLLRKGEALTQMGKTGDAIKTFEQAVAKAPTNFEVRYAFAKTLARGGQLARARLEYSTILVSFGLDEAGRKTIQRELDALSK